MNSSMPAASVPGSLGYPRVNYAALMDEYEGRLETMERGFAMDVEFLDGWVPDDDHSKGLFYLFETASFHDLPGLSVDLTPDVLESIDGEGLVEALRTLGGVHVARRDGQVVLTVSFDGRLGEAVALEEVRGLSSVHTAYRDRLLAETRVITHRIESTVETAVIGYTAKGLRVVRAAFQGGTVVAAVDPAHNHRAKALRHIGVPDGATLRLLDLFCRRLEGSGLQELAEHGVIRLENWLRDARRPPPVRGLVTPETAGPGFAALADLGRRLFGSYRGAYGVPVERNCNEEPLSPEWLQLSEADRVDTLRTTIASELASLGMTSVKFQVMKVEQNSQVFMSLDGCSSERDKRVLIRTLEKRLKFVIEPRIELYLPSASDRLKRDQQNPLMRPTLEVSR